MTGKSTQILLIDDHAVVRCGLRAMIEVHSGFTVVGEACDGREGVDMASQLRPHIVIMDIGMPELNGFEATRQVLLKSPKSQVLVLSMHRSEQVVREALQAGARGYVLKSDAAIELLDALEAIREKRTFFSACLRDFVDQTYTRDIDVLTKPAKSRSELTPREREIMQLLAEGKTNKGVAERLAISVKTAETHRARIMRKLRMESVADLVRYAIRNRVIDA